MASCPKRGVLNAGDRPGRLVAAVAQLQAAAQPFRPRVMPIATRRAVPMSTPMRSGRGVPLSTVGLGNLPPGSRVAGSGPTDGPLPRGPQVSGTGGLGNPGRVAGTAPITHGGLGSNGTSSGPLDGGPLGAMGPFVSAITDWAQQVTDAIGAITDTISAGGMAVLWASDMLIGPYTEPMRIWAPEFMPLAIFAGRIINTRNHAAPILSGCAVEWSGTESREYIVCKSIDGMAPNDGQTYAFTFLYFGMG